MNSSIKLFLLHAAIILAITTTHAMSEKGDSIRKLITPLSPCHSKIEELIDSFHGLTLYAGNFSQLPNDILSIILIPQECEFLKKENRYNYPWDEFIRVIRRNSVCKRWLTILADYSTIAAHLQIPPMHLAAMMGDVDKILDLKFAGHSILRFDCHHFGPAHYAVGNKQVRVLKILKIGCALENKKLCKDLQDLVKDDDKNVLQLLAEIKTEYQGQVIQSDKKFEKNFKKIIKHNDMELLENALLKDDQQTLNCIAHAIDEMYENSPVEKALSHIKRLFWLTANSDQKAILARLLYKMACTYEYTLYNILRLEAIDRGARTFIESIFDGFQQFGCNPNDCDELGITFIQRACATKSNLPILSKLLECKNVDLNLQAYHQFTPLHYALSKKNSDAVKILLSRKDTNGLTLVNVNVKADFGCTPLHVAICNKVGLDLIKLLLAHGADLNAQTDQGGSVIHAAIDYDSEALDFLLDTGKCNLELKDERGYTPLGHAIGFKPHYIKLLLQKGASTNVKDHKGESLLHFAARNSPESLGILVGYMRKQVNSPSTTGLRPLHRAAENDVRCVQLLLTHGAMVDALNNNNETPLHYAASYGKPECVELLVKHGAFIDNRISDNVVFEQVHYGGFTPLHLAVYKKHLEAIKTLVVLGANVTLKTALDKTVLDLANESGDEEIIAYISKVLQYKATQDILSVVGNYNEENK
jgi:ankyrin repeat protein